MANPEVIAQISSNQGFPPQKGVMLSQLASDWATANSDPGTADNAGNTIVNPSAVTREEVSLVRTQGFGTAAQVRFAYDAAATVTTPPTVQVFGLDGRSPASYQRLKSAADQHELQLSASANDVTDGQYKYTEWQEVVLAGCQGYKVCIKTASALSGGSLPPMIQTRVINYLASESATISGGEAHIGQVGGTTQVIAVQPTVDTAAYASGDCIGGKLTITNAARVSGGSGVLQSIRAVNRSASQNKRLRIVVFNADPTNATLTDNAAFVFSTDDYKVVDVFDIGVSDWKTIDSKFVATLRNLGVPFKAVGSANLFAALIDGGDAIDFVNATDLQIAFGILQD